MIKRHEDFYDLLNYIEESYRPIPTQYLMMNIRSMLRYFSKEDIKEAIDIARTKPMIDNWAKYIWGILWKRKKEK